MQPALLENPNLSEPAVQLLFVAAILGWNLSLFPIQRWPAIIEQLLEPFSFSAPEERDALVSSVKSFAEVKRERFPNDRRLVLKHSVDYRGPGAAHHLQVYSTPIPE